MGCPSHDYEILYNIHLTSRFTLEAILAGLMKEVAML